ncbi:MAG: hypothetical protein K5682_03055 [Lachnospiraceae bacterium]|nr:hypothetical protein [Lachnospiraceae bacterium]
MKPDLLEQLGIDVNAFDMEAVGRASVRKVCGNLPPELYGNVDYSYLEESDEKERLRFEEAVRNANEAKIQRELMIPPQHPENGQ